MRRRWGFGRSARGRIRRARRRAGDAWLGVNRGWGERGWRDGRNSTARFNNSLQMAVVERNQEIQTLLRNSRTTDSLRPVRYRGNLLLFAAAEEGWVFLTVAGGLRLWAPKPPKKQRGRPRTSPTATELPGGHAGASGQLWSKKQAFPQKRFVASRNQDHSGGVKRKPQTTTRAVNDAAAAEQQRHPELDGT